MEDSVGSDNDDAQHLKVDEEEAAAAAAVVIQQQSKESITLMGIVLAMSTRKTHPWQ